MNFGPFSARRVMYLEVGGYAEFLEVRPEDGLLEDSR